MRNVIILCSIVEYANTSQFARSAIDAEGCSSSNSEACVVRYNADVIEKIKKREAAVEDCGAADGEACVIKYGPMQRSVRLQ